MKSSMAGQCIWIQFVFIEGSAVFCSLLPPLKSGKIPSNGETLFIINFLILEIRSGDIFKVSLGEKTTHLKARRVVVHLNKSVI